MKKVRTAVIGGTGLEYIFAGTSKTRIGTPYGPSPTITVVKIGAEEVAFLPRHGEKHAYPPHKVNYHANIWSLHSLGVERILATNAVGAINPSYRPSDLVIPKDFIDFTKLRSLTFYDEAPVTHIDMTEPYCPDLRRILIKAAKTRANKVWDNAVYVCVEGPRYETPAEIRMFQALGCDIIGMTGAPEAALARELAICYAPICFVTNRAAGMQDRLTTEDVIETCKKTIPALQQVLKETITNIPKKRDCPCSHALEGARI